MLIRDTFMLLKELAVEQDKDTCIIDLKLTCGPTMWPINVYECDSPPPTHTHKHTHNCTCTCTCILYNRDRTGYICGPHSVGGPAGGNKTGGPAGSRETSLISTAAWPYNTVGFSSMGLQDPLDDGGGVWPWVMASEYLSSWWQHLYIIPNVFHPCSVAHRYLPACAVVVHQHAYKTLPGTRCCCNWQAQWRSYQHSSLEGMY